MFFNSKITGCRSTEPRYMYRSNTKRHIGILNDNLALELDKYVISTSINYQECLFNFSKKVLKEINIIYNYSNRKPIHSRVSFRFSILGTTKLNWNTRELVDIPRTKVMIMFNIKSYSPFHIVITNRTIFLFNPSNNSIPFRLIHRIIYI